MKLSDFSFTAPDKKTASAAPAETRQAETEHASLESLFRSLAAENADAEALAGGGCTLSFGELDVLSERIARFIMERGYGPEAVVGVLCARGARYLAAAIGVMGNKPEPVIILDSVADNSRAKQMAAKDDIELLQTILQQGLAFDPEKLRVMTRTTMWKPA
jgi:Non-ribosomal peptide synthetase modules and related proteins